MCTIITIQAALHIAAERTPMPEGKVYRLAEMEVL